MVMITTIKTKTKTKRNENAQRRWVAEFKLKLSAARGAVLGARRGRFLLSTRCIGVCATFGRRVMAIFTTRQLFDLCS